MDRFPYAGITVFDKAFIEKAPDIERHTIPIYKKVENKFQHQGTGILAFIEDQCILITAGHVLESFYKLAVPANGKLHYIYHFADYFQKSPDDEFDFGFVAIDHDLGSMLVNNFVMLPLSRITTNHTPVQIIQYMILGFPSVFSKSDITEKKITGASIKILGESCHQKVYKHYKIDREKQIAFLLAGAGNDLRTGKRKDMKKELYGISGCGIWLFEATPLPFIQASYSLVGIITDFRKGKFHCAFGYKLKLLWKK